MKQHERQAHEWLTNTRGMPLERPVQRTHNWGRMLHRAVRLLVVAFLFWYGVSLWKHLSLIA
jgi:hypothetical protein